MGVEPHNMSSYNHANKSSIELPRQCLIVVSLCLHKGPP